MANSNPKPPNAGNGRPKGAVNKTTAILKEAIIKAAEEVGEDQNGKGGVVGYLRNIAQNEPKAFCTLLGRVIPLQVEGTGDDNEIIFRTTYVSKPSD